MVSMMVVSPPSLLRKYSGGWTPRDLKTKNGGEWGRIDNVLTAHPAPTQKTAQFSALHQPSTSPVPAAARHTAGRPYRYAVPCWRTNMPPLYTSRLLVLIQKDPKTPAKDRKPLQPCTKSIPVGSDHYPQDEVNKVSGVLVREDADV